MSRKFSWVLFFLLMFVTVEKFGAKRKQWSNSKEIYSKLNYHRDNLNEDSAIYYVDELINYLNKPGDVIGKNDKIATLLLFDRQAQAFELALEAYEFCRSNQNEDICFECSLIYLRLAHFMNLLEEYDQGLAYLDYTCPDFRTGEYYYHKAKLYVAKNNPDSAYLMGEQWLSQLDVSMPQNLIGAYNQNGLIARYLNNHEGAIASFLKAVEVIKKNGFDQGKYAYILGNIGHSYLRIGNYTKAYEYLELDSKASEINNVIQSHITAELALVEIDMLNGDHRVLQERLKSLLIKYDKRLTLQQKVDIHKVFLDSYKQEGNEDAYREKLEIWTELSQRNFTNEIERTKLMSSKYAAASLAQVQQKMKLETQVKEQRIELLEVKEKNSRILLYLIISCVTILLIILYFLFRRFKSIQSRKERVRVKQLDYAKQKQQQLSEKIIEENKNVQTLSQELILKEDFSNDLLKELKKLENVSSSELKSIELFIRNSLDMKSTVANVVKELGGANSDFQSKLIQLHPNLADGDIKLAAMISIGMSNKEIGISKNIATDSVKKTKYRLKKKLNLPSEVDLNTYLKKLTN